MPRSRFKKGQAAQERMAVHAAHLEELTVQYLPRESLKPNDYNPNRQSEHEFDLLCRSMAEDGFTQPILAAEDLTIVDGEHRWKAAGVIGLDQVPVVVMPMPPAQARIATLRHNRARGQEDLDLSAAVLRDLQRLGALDWAAESLLLSDAEIERLAAIPEPEDYEEVRQAAPGAQPGRRSSPDMGPQQIGAVREAEVRARERDSQDEAEKLRNDDAAWQLMLTYTDEEADVVREVLQDRPAHNLLALCRAEAERRTANASR